MLGKTEQLILRYTGKGVEVSAPTALYFHLAIHQKTLKKKFVARWASVFFVEHRVRLFV